MLIFFYGEDSFRLNQKIRELKKKFLEKDISGSGLSVFDFEEKAETKRIVSTFGTANLLSPKRFVIIKNIISAGQKQDQDEMLEYLKNNPNISKNDDLIIVFCENNQPRKNSTFYKFLETKEIGVKIQKFEKLIGAKLADWIVRRIKEVCAESGITKSALEKLILFVGSDTGSLEMEIQKLVNYAEKKTIEDADVELLVRANVDNNIFQTIDALANGDKKKALKLLHNHIENGENVFYIFSMFIYQFRNFVKVIDLKENQGMGEYEITKMLKLNPFVVKKCLWQAQKFPMSRLKKIYQKLVEVDMDVKTGKMKMELALDRFIVEM
jgi:DNA polymerase-3 subunit delta